MTKKDYVSIASVMHHQLHSREIRADYPIFDDVVVGSLRTLANKFADSFAAGNPQFDRERFMTACGF